VNSTLNNNRINRRRRAAKRRPERAARDERPQRGWPALAARALAVAAGLAAVAAVVYVSLNARPWRLQNYTVRGMSYVTAAEIMRASGLRLGDNLFTADLRAAERRLARVPRVRRATVSRRLPGEVVITVEERPAVAALVVNGELYKVAADGVVLEPVAAAYEDLPLLTGYGYRMKVKGAYPRITRPEVADGLRVLEVVSRVDASWYAAVECCNLRTRTLAWDGGRRVVRYGADFDEGTARRLRRVFAETAAAEAVRVVYDVRFGKDVVVTGPGSAGAGEAGGGPKHAGTI